ncbi:fucose isomerase [Alloacidobacterium dinghuense]|uniref:Fucose isomerase n=1 Tax=Alloacidobacterium dinghuense TaxID=2763107 RepID=A0A7G8BJI7_9BACT|nr:fucose isomerase [Alloacidobacterium dinghuense]QNI32707.1 fucose isomerase [Alloacidobacterium dinghuense]
MAVTKDIIKEVVLITSGDLRQSANLACWPAQEEMERELTRSLEQEGVRVKRAFPVDLLKGHGFISSQRMGMDIFADIDPKANLIFATAAWQYTHHVLPGLRSHRGPILTIANWSGKWPGLVGLLNLNGSLVKAGVKFSSLWSEDFKDKFFLNGLRAWIRDKEVVHDTSHVRDLDAGQLPSDAKNLGTDLAASLKRRKAILGVFDEGCMGMYNAIIDDELLNPTGVFKERLSQSALVARMRTVQDEEAADIRHWLDKRGLRFVTGPDETSDLTDKQILEQCKMYIAAVRIAHEFGCDAIGIQYQQGLKDMAPASDLVEGLLNNVERPPVYDVQPGKELYPGQPVPHFNEVDEGAGLDALVTNLCWNALQLDPATTLHDVRWGEHFTGNGIDDFVWVLQISGAAPASHFVGGYKGASSERQPPMYFPLGGGTLKGIGKAGEIVWSRVFVEGGSLHVDIGRGSVVELPAEETARRWRSTTSQWPLVSAIFHGITRDAFMARHRANHVSIAYAPNVAVASKALAVKSAMFHEMGVKVHLCGEIHF